MDPVVTARVPAGIRSRGIEVLHEIGSTTSELVNAAFEYVIQERQLPHAKLPKTDQPAIRALSTEQALELSRFMEGVKAPAPESWNELSFEQLFDQAMEERYAGLR